MYFEDLNLNMTMRLEKITISGRALAKEIIKSSEYKESVKNFV